MILGDSSEYEFFDEAIQLLKNPIGVSVTISIMEVNRGSLTT